MDVSLGREGSWSRRWNRRGSWRRRAGGCAYAAGVLHGRDRERERLAVLFDDARGSRGGALVVRGQPGVGKTALLADLIGRAEGMQVLRTQGIESESPLAFAALQRLLRPAMRHVEALPGAAGHRAARGVRRNRHRGRRPVPGLPGHAEPARRDGRRRHRCCVSSTTRTGWTRPPPLPCFSWPAGSDRNGSRCCSPPATGTCAVSTAASCPSWWWAVSTRPPRPACSPTGPVRRSPTTSGTG